MTDTSKPREIDPVASFDGIVKWIEDTARANHAPGLIVGISGTDSILTFLACAKAFENLGKPERVIGLNFEHEGHKHTHGITCVSGEFNWVAREIFPYLAQKAPHAKLEIDRTIKVSDDNLRWGRLFSRAVSETSKGADLTSKHYFPVGSRNATEDYLGTYSQVSKAVSMLPLINLFKSEVIQICEALDVPQIAIDKSREIDCDCGRFDVQAHHMRELDLVIMSKLKMLDEQYLKDNIPAEILKNVDLFRFEEKALNKFRLNTPYRAEPL